MEVTQTSRSNTDAVDAGALRRPPVKGKANHASGGRLPAELDSNRSDTLARQAYLALREGIILGRYREGERLAEQRLAEELAVSRVPLREAFPQLEMEGFVRTVPRRSAVVARWDAKAVNDLFDLRLCFEVGAARYAARQVGAGESPEPLDRALAYSREVVREGDPYKVAQASTAYHEAIVEVAGNQLMKNIMRLVTGRMVWLFYLTSQLAAEIALEEHDQLRNAIWSGNEPLAESIAYVHIEHDRIPSFRALEAQQMAARLGGRET
jgi:DNA-binding GntR family transcriptional regulator